MDLKNRMNKFIDEYVDALDLGKDLGNQKLNKNQSMTLLKSKWSTVS